MTEFEETRAAELFEAQSKAERLFNEIEARGLIRSAITENTMNADIYALAKEMYGDHHLLAQANRLARARIPRSPMRRIRRT